MTPEQWPTFGTIDAPRNTVLWNGPVCPMCNTMYVNAHACTSGGTLILLPAPPSEIVVAAEEHPFEIEVRVRAHGQEDAVLHREYISHDAASTDKAIKEVWDGMSAGTKSRMRLVGSDK
jgi:hypothetical protein